MDELGSERNHSEFFVKGLFLFDGTEHLCGRRNTLSKRFHEKSCFVHASHASLFFVKSRCPKLFSMSFVFQKNLLGLIHSHSHCYQASWLGLISTYPLGWPLSLVPYLADFNVATFLGCFSFFGLLIASWNPMAFPRCTLALTTSVWS
jgi:hypothetical protein